MSEKTVLLSEEEALSLSRKILLKKGFSDDFSRAISETVIAGQKDGRGSHGLYRILGCINTLASGGVVPDAEPHIEPSSGGIVKVNANGGGLTTRLLSRSTAADRKDQREWYRASCH
jgi:LDH2 family malate/lactate/ureidoglycolate dehydrogenase